MNDYSYEADKMSEQEWHELLPAFRDAFIEQTWSYAAFRWPKAELSHLVVKKNQHIVAASQVVLLPFPLVGGGIAFIKFGPMWLLHGQAIEQENLRQVILFLHQEYVVKRGLFLRIMPSIAHMESTQISNALLTTGFKNSQIENPKRYLVDLSHPVDELRKSLKGRWRSSLKKAEKRGLEVVQIEGEAAMEQFMPLYEKMLKRKSFADSSAIDELPEICKNLPSKLTPTGFFCMYNEQCVGSVIISFIGETALYLFGATDDKGLEVGAGFFLHWKVINWLCEQDVQWYDLGGDCGNSGLRQFKSGLVGKLGVITPLPGNFELCEINLSWILAKLAFAARDFKGSVQSKISDFKHTLSR